MEKVISFEMMHDALTQNILIGNGVKWKMYSTKGQR
jgi:hypothetical protein